MTPDPDPLAARDDDADIELWRLTLGGFQAAARLLRESIDEALDLSASEAETLLALRRRPDGRAAMKALAADTAYSSGGFTKLADKMVRRGLVTREPVDTDRRTVLLALTPAGAEAADELAVVAAAAIRRTFVDVLGRDRAEEVARTLDELHRAHRPPAH